MIIIKTFAALTAAAVLIPLSAPVPSAAADTPGTTSDTNEYVPDWVPDDLESAIKFSNTYGVTHVQDNYACIVFPEDIMTGPASAIGQERYSFETTNEAMIEISRRKIIGAKSKDFNVVVYRCKHKGDIEITVIDTWAAPPPPDTGITNEVAHYSFSVSESYRVTETDILGWAPDCPAEFSEYVEKNGRISAKDNFVVVCFSYNSGTTDEWLRISYGGDCLKLKEDLAAIDIEYNAQEGGIVNSVYVYEAVKDGYDNIGYAPVFTSAAPDATVTVDLIVLDNAQTVLLPDDKRITVRDYDSGELIDVEKHKGFAVKQIVNTPNTAPIIADITSNPCILRNMELTIDESTYLAMPYGFKAPTIPDTILVSDDHVEVTKYENGAEDIVYKVIAQPSGDVNGDGELSIADLVLMQKWLLAAPDTELTDWSAGDYTKDGVIDVFDLVLMRKTIINTPVAPIALELTKEGGIMGTYNKWKVYYEDGEYKLAAPKRGGLVRDNETVVYNITKQEYLRIMSVDYAEIIAKEPSPSEYQIADSFSYDYKITYANGETAEVLRFTSDVIYDIQDIARHYQNNDQTEPWGAQE